MGKQKTNLLSYVKNNWLASLEETKNPHPPNLYDLETEKKDTIAKKNGFPTPRNVVLCEHSQKIIRKKKKNSSNRHSLHNPILRCCDLAEKVVLRKRIVLFFSGPPIFIIKKDKKALAR